MLDLSGLLQPILDNAGLTPEYLQDIKDRLENALITIENMEQDVKMIKDKLGLPDTYFVEEEPTDD